MRFWIIAAAALFYAGALWDNTWSTVDDGNDLSRTVAFRQQIARGRLTFQSVLDGWNIAPVGLFRPCNAWLRLAEYELCGLDAWKHHLLRFVIALGLCQVVFSIAFRATRAPRAAFLAALCFVLFPPNVEFWFPLNDPVFYPTVFATVSLWLMIRALETAGARRWLFWLASAALYIPVYFTKENSLAFLGIAAAILLACRAGAGRLLDRRNLPLAAVNLAAHAGLIAVWFILRKLVAVPAVAAGGYTSDYAVAPGVMLATAFKYADVFWNSLQLLTPLALTILLRRLWLWRRKRQALDDADGWAFVGLCWLGSVLMMMLPWKHPIARYLVAATPGIALFVGLTLYRFLPQTTPATGEPPSRRRRVARWLIVGNLAVLPFITLIRNYDYFVFRHDYDRAAFTVIETLGRDAPRDARLFMNLPAGSYSIFQDIVRLLALLHGRADVRQFNYNDPGRPDPRPGDYLLLFTREPPGRTPEMALDGAFHQDALKQLGDRLRLVTHARYDRMLLRCHPDAPIFNAVAQAGLPLPDYLGMHKTQRRGFIQRERSLVEWRVYQFER
jgi:hypothetical protein